MLSLEDVERMMNNGQELPQQKHPKPSTETVELLTDAEPEMLNLIFTADDEGEDPAGALLVALKELSKEHGWFNTACLLCMLFAHRYQTEDVPHLPGVSLGTMNLLRILPLAAKAEDRDPGAWTVPMAMIADLGEKEPLDFTACAGFCAGVGHMRKVSEAGT